MLQILKNIFIINTRNLFYCMYIFDKFRVPLFSSFKFTNRRISDQHAHIIKFIGIYSSNQIQKQLSTIIVKHKGQATFPGIILTWRFRLNMFYCIDYLKTSFNRMESCSHLLPVWTCCTVPTLTGRRSTTSLGVIPV